MLTTLFVDAQPFVGFDFDNCVAEHKTKKAICHNNE